MSSIKSCLVQKKMSRTDSKITLFNIRFNLNAYKNLSVEELDALSDPASKFFMFYSSFQQEAQTT